MWRDGGLVCGEMEVLYVERWRSCMWRDGGLVCGEMEVLYVERWKSFMWRDGGILCGEIEDFYVERWGLVHMGRDRGLVHTYVSTFGEIEVLYVHVYMYM